MASESKGVLDNDQLTKDQLLERHSRLLGAKAHIVDKVMRAPYTTDHAIVKALDREIDDVMSALRNK